MGYHCSFPRTTLFILLETLFVVQKGSSFTTFTAQKQMQVTRALLNLNPTAPQNRCYGPNHVNSKRCLRLGVICRAHVIDTVCIAAGWIGLMKSMTSWLYFWGYFFSFHMV